MDLHGNIDIVDRKKDIIISGGENISSIEVEGVLYDHPAVLEAAVIAVPHEKWGETPHAFIVKKEDAEIAAEDFILFTRGKIQKIRLRQEYWKADGKGGRFVN
ncbi:acyl-CoA synthetase (AMP-forming)/AMP-acid ligase II [Mycobacteroides abscessus subsp. abscessus]|nr:acyl-CoA synthetase (AMP-forming)/AMP-acid ligase II [Mycobacteroides abscessus subsp. abscessus]